jgi:hypothetical protein
MFDQVFDSMRKATESTLQMQKELYARWASFWPGLPGLQPDWAAEAQKLQKRWAETVGELAKKQRASLEEQFQIGLRGLEGAFGVAEVKDVEDLRKKSLELWQKSFDCLRQMQEAQLRDFQHAVSAWTQLMTRGAS